MAIEELAVDGIVSLGAVSERTVQRYRKNINDILDAQDADWRIRADNKRRLLIVVPN